MKDYLALTEGGSGVGSVGAGGSVGGMVGSVGGSVGAVASDSVGVAVLGAMVVDGMLGFWDVDGSFPAHPSMMPIIMDSTSSKHISLYCCVFMGASQMSLLSTIISPFPCNVNASRSLPK